MVVRRIGVCNRNRTPGEAVNSLNSNLTWVSRTIGRGHDRRREGFERIQNENRCRPYVSPSAFLLLIIGAGSVRIGNCLEKTWHFVGRRLFKPPKNTFKRIRCPVLHNASTMSSTIYSTRLYRSPKRVFGFLFLFDARLGKSNGLTNVKRLIEWTKRNGGTALTRPLKRKRLTFYKLTTAQWQDNNSIDRLIT